MQKLREAIYWMRCPILDIGQMGMSEKSFVLCNNKAKEAFDRVITDVTRYLDNQNHDCPYVVYKHVQDLYTIACQLPIANGMTISGVLDKAFTIDALKKVMDVIHNMYKEDIELLDNLENVS